MKKILLALGAVVIIAAAARGFWAYQQMNKQAPVVAAEISLPAANETAGWKTYTSSKYGFSIQYPKDTQINDVDISGGRNISFAISQGEVMVEVVTTAWYNGVLSAPANCNDFDSGVVTSHVAINGIDFLKGDVSRDLSGMNSATSATEYCTVQNGTGYKIIPRMPDASRSNASVNNNTILDQMVKSFVLSRLRISLVSEPKRTPKPQFYPYFRAYI